MFIDILKTMNKDQMKNEIQNAQCPSHESIVAKAQAFHVLPGYPNTAASLLHTVHHANVQAVV
jgi:hypothetical protein